MVKKQTLADERATYALGAKLASLIRIGDVVALSGGLGSGKTCLARGLIWHLLGQSQEVPSPSFTLVQSYASSPPIWHVDLYRLDSLKDIAELGLFDALNQAALVIEWAEKMGTQLPADRLGIELTPHHDFNQRCATLTAHGASWKERLHALK